MSKIDYSSIDETDVNILYICSYGQTGIPICVDIEHEYCKLLNRNDKECNLRPVVNYDNYKVLKEKNEELRKCLDGIEKYCEEQNLKYDTTACDILRIIEEVTSNEQKKR